MQLIEKNIINAVKEMLTGRVNELLEESENQIPLIEFGYGISPVIRLATAERSEKERIIKSDVYSVVLVFAVPEIPDGEWNCYAYAAAVDLALGEDATMGVIFHECIEGEIDRAGWWSFWAFITFGDGRTAAGETARLFVWQEGAI